VTSSALASPLALPGLYSCITAPRLARKKGKEGVKKGKGLADLVLLPRLAVLNLPLQGTCRGSSRLP